MAYRKPSLVGVFLMLQEGVEKMVQISLKNLIMQSNFEEAIKASSQMHPADVAETLREIPFTYQTRFITVLTPERAAEILQDMELDDEADILGEMEPEKAAEILKQMYTDEAADLLAELPEKDSEELIALMKDEGQEIKELLEYEEDTSGGLMATEFVPIREEQTVEDVLAFLRLQAPSAENAYYLYVIGNDQTLTGVVSLRELVVNPLETKISSIMKRDIITVREDLDQEEVARIFEKYGFLVLPVVDKENKLVGVITVDDVLDVAEEEATEDIHKGASITPLETGYDNAKIWTLFSKRIVWLVVLIVVNLVSSGVIAAYENILSSAIALAFFIPLLIDTGGNTGAQSATLIIRALVTGDVRIKDWGKVFVKELFVGVCLGLVLGFAGSMLGIARGGYEVGLVVGLTMVAIVIVANLIGMTLPFVLTLLRLDPAVASSPLITSIADATGLIIYFSIASQVLRL